MGTQVTLNSGSVDSAGSLLLKTNGTTTAVAIDTSQNIGIGTTSPGFRLDVQSGAAAQANFQQTSANSYGEIRVTGNSRGGQVEFLNGSTRLSGIYGDTSNNLIFVNGTGDTERARIDSSGNLLVGTTSQYSAGKVSVLGTASTNGIVYRDAANNYTFLGQNSSGTNTFLVNYNGNVTNTNNSYGAISDVKLKENITDATPKLDQLNQVRIVNYNFIGEQQKQLGVIAQELEQIFPGMVEETADYENVTNTDEEGNEITERVATGTTTKSVKYSVFVPMLIKAIQELTAEVDALKNK